MTKLVQLSPSCRKSAASSEEDRRAVQKYMDEDYAENIIDEKELYHSQQWFLPHHGVYVDTTTPLTPPHPRDS